MGIVIPEHKLRDIISQMPKVDYQGGIGDRSIQFGWGDKTELNRYLKLKKEDSYPLMWLLSPSPELHIYKSTRVERDCSIVIATLETRKDLYNPQRYNFSFDIVLNPIADYFMQGIRSASTTMFLNEDNVTLNKFPNYSDESQSDKSGAIALWDAIRIDCRIEFKNSCLNEIKWITN